MVIKSIQKSKKSKKSKISRKRNKVRKRTFRNKKSGSKHISRKKSFRQKVPRDMITVYFTGTDAKREIKNIAKSLGGKWEGQGKSLVPPFEYDVTYSFQSGKHKQFANRIKHIPNVLHFS